MRLLCAVLLVSFLFFPVTSRAIVRRHDVDVNEVQGLYKSLSNSFDSVVWIESPSATPGSVTRGSGTLIAPDWILTAAHVIDHLTQPQWGTIDIGNGSANGLGEFTLGGRTVTNVQLHPNWDSTFQHPDFTSGVLGNYQSGDDFALIQLSTPVTYSAMNRHSGTVASLLEHDVTFVGYGRTGTGYTGDTDPSGTKRGGQNVIDRRGSALDPNGCPPNCRYDYSHDLILTDFDSTIRISNIAPHNRWESATPESLEAATGQGDSGGPWVVGGRLAGVTSFGLDAEYGDYNAAGAVSPHNNWINEVMGGLNWNTRNQAFFDNATAWGDGRIPNSGTSVQFSFPEIVGSIPVIVLRDNRSAREVQVEFGPHEFALRNFTFTATGPITVDDGGTMIVDTGDSGGLLRATAADGIRVGHFTNATLIQERGNVQVDGSLFLGSNTGGDGEYQLNAGQLTVGGSFNVGHRGEGKFVHRAGTVIANNLSIGAFPTANGEYQLANGVLKSDVLQIGQSGNTSVSLLSITGDEGEIEVNDQLIVGASGNGSLDQSAGTVTVDGSLTVGANSGSMGIYNLSGGDLDVSQGTVDFGAGTGEFNFTGGTLHVGTYNGDLDNAGGILEHNNWDSTTTITGAYEQEPSAALSFLIGSSASNPLLVEAETLETILDGSLLVSLANGFDPTGFTFNILNSAGPLSGTIADLAFTGTRITVSQGLGSFQLTASAANGGYGLWLDDFQAAPQGLPGDFDLDGDVDGRDFLAWQRGNSPNPLSASDLAVWQNSYGNQSLTANVAVPEPSAAVLISSLLLAHLIRRRTV